MEYEKFSKIIDLIKSESERNSKLYKLGVDITDLNDGLHNVINILIEEIYGEEGLDWFSWFCYESDFGEKDWSKGDTYRSLDGILEKIPEEKKSGFGATDADGTPICYSIESTWEYLEKNHKRQ